MNIPLWQIDAFTNQVFAGNPAAVCPLESWLEDGVLQAVATENNLSETAFLVQAGPDYQIRWFTPAQEVDLCGHATLAAGYVVLNYLESGRPQVTFHSPSGPLTVERAGDLLSMAFPSRPPVACPVPEDLLKGLGRPPLQVLRSRDYLAIYASEAEVRSLQPDFDRLRGLDALGVIATGPSQSVDFVSRFFAPQAGIPEDPVTGSAHCTLVPYWSERLGKSYLHARQVSARGGELFCELRGETVIMAGHAVCYLTGTIQL